MDKAALVQAIRAQLAEQEQTLRRAADKAREAATHEEAKPENDKDTRALESSYLAGAQAAKARELKAALNELSFLPLEAFSLVTLTRSGKRVTYFVSPYGGGLKVGNVVVVTAQSPVGQAIIAKKAGDVIEIAGAECEIESVE